MTFQKMHFTSLYSLLSLALLFISVPNRTVAQTMDSLDVTRLVPKVHSSGIIGNDTNTSGPNTAYASDTSSVLFSAGIWLAGEDKNQNAFFGGHRFISSSDTGMHYYPGPSADTYDSNYDNTYDRVWKLDRDTLEYHANNWWKSGYQTPQMIQDWPAHGDTSNGEAHQLSHFKDLNNNGAYEPKKGDRPIMRGDKAIYFIANDSRGPIASDENPLGVEVHGMVYVLDCPSNEALNNSFFVHYEIIIRSDCTFTNGHLAQFNDFDIGCPYDDYIGSDIDRGLLFAYNGDDMDTGYCDGFGTYDSIPPAIGVTFLKGPQRDSTGSDNSAGPLTNGTGYGDGIPDNEHWGMSGAYHYYAGTGPKGDPQSLADHFNYMRGFWRDGTAFTYGGNGYDPTGSSNLTSYVFPWDSYPGRPFWSEDSASNPPDRRRGLAVSGPMIIKPWDTLRIDMAYVAAKDPDTLGAHSPIDELMARVDTVRKYYRNEQVPCSDGSFSSIPEKDPSFSAKAFPNPSEGSFKIQLKGQGRSYRYELYNIRGSLIKSGHWKESGTHRLPIRDASDGLYFLRIRSGSGSGKVFKLMKR